VSGHEFRFAAHSSPSDSCSKPSDRAPHRGQDHVSTARALL
jgi:hypothetical protein